MLVCGGCSFIVLNTVYMLGLYSYRSEVKVQIELNIGLLFLKSTFERNDKTPGP